MKKPLLFALLAGLAFLVWKYVSQRSALPAQAPTIKPPLKPNAPSSELLALFPKALGAIFNQPSSAAGVAPGRTWDPEFVRDSYDLDPIDYADAGIY